MFQLWTTDERELYRVSTEYAGWMWTAAGRKTHIEQPNKEALWICPVGMSHFRGLVDGCWILVCQTSESRLVGCRS